ncbi:MAG: lysophospholipid acyltransferase family protein [Flavobacteriales bacterium]|nr:lysophospholipid acyltransferase family protein [Flavobacteriales bacterium]
MGLVTAKEIAKAINLSKFGFLGAFLGWLLLKITRLSEMNRFYNQYKNKSDLAFLEAVINDYKIQFEIPESDLKRLPKSGPFVTVSNHPLGAIDGILLLKLLLEHNSDYKVMANFLLHRIDPLKSCIIPVNPFEDHKHVKSSVGGIKDALRHLSEGKPLGVFPAGEVSTFLEGDAIVDRPWEESAIRLIKKAKVPVIPIYFHASNSSFFYKMVRWNPIFRTALLPSQVLSQKSRTIKIRIGKPISLKEQEEYKDVQEYSNFLRRKTYMLAKAFEKKEEEEDVNGTQSLANPKSIVEPGSSSTLQTEVDKLRENGNRLLQSKNYEVYFAEAKAIPQILHEIGRLREITFREIGEGTNESIDIDRFDNFYHHLFLWDVDAKIIAGAYRMGLGKTIFEKYGIRGFYLNDLFRFEPELYNMMAESIEMGRAFVVKEYQQKPMPLFLLWRGILHITLRYPEHKYLIGGVSISNQFSDFSKSLMIEFMKSHFYDPYVAQYVHPKKEYKVKLKDADKDFVFNESEADLDKFDKVIDELEPGNLRLPVLIKKYIKQNAKVVAFNVDPLFNNAIDGLFYIKIADIPESTVKPVMEEFQAELEQKSQGLDNNK